MSTIFERVKFDDSQLDSNKRGTWGRAMTDHDAAYFLDLARKTSGLPSDYKLSKELDVSRQFVSNLRAGHIPIPVQIADKLGTLCGMDGAVVYAEIQAARAKRTDVRAFWERVARSLAASLVLVFVGLFAPAQDAAAAGMTAFVEHAKVYIMRTVAALRRALHLAWARAVVYSFAYQ